MKAEIKLLLTNANFYYYFINTNHIVHEYLYAILLNVCIHRH